PAGPPESHAQHLAAAEALQRISVAAIASRPDPYVAVLRRTEGGGDELLPLLQGSDADCGPFHLRAALVDPHPRVRARAALALRPATSQRTLEPLRDAEVPELVALLGQDRFGAVRARLHDTSRLGPVMRRRLGTALIAAGLRTPPDPPEPGPSPFAARSDAF